MPAPATSELDASSAKRRRRRHPFFWLVPAALVASGVLLVMSLAYLRSQAITSSERLVDSLALVIAEQTARTLQTIDQRLELAVNGLQRIHAAGGLNPQSTRLVPEDHVPGLPFAAALRMVDAQGLVVVGTGGDNPGRSIADQPYFRTAKAAQDTGFQLATPSQEGPNGKWSIAASRPVRTAEGGFGGLVVTDLDPLYLDRLWRTIDLGPGGSITLLRRDGTLLMRSPFDATVMAKNFRQQDLFAKHLPGSQAGAFQDTSLIDGMRRQLAYRTLTPQGDLVVIVGKSLDFVLAPWRQLAALALAVWAAVALAMGLLGRFLNRSWKEHTREQARVQQVTQRLSLAVNAANMSVWDWNLQTDQWYATPTYFSMLGRDPAEGFVDNAQWVERIHPEDREVVAARIAEALAAKDTPYQYEARMRHADGGYRWIQVSGRAAAHDNQGKARRLLGVTRDITEQKESELALRDSEAHYRELFRNNPHPMWIFDLETLAFLDVNDAAVLHYGYSREEFLAMTIRDIRPPEDLAALDAHLGQVREGMANPQDTPWRHQRKDGSVILVETVSHTLVFDGRPARFIHAHDVTQRHLAQAQLRASEEDLAITLQSIGDAVIATDAAGSVTRMNPTAERLTGWPLGDAIGRPLNEVFQIIHAQSRASAINPVDLVMRHGQVVGLANHTALLARDGCEYQIFDSAAPIRGPDGTVTGVVLVFSDVTTQYATQAALRANEERFRSLIEWTPDAVAVHQDGLLVYVNPAAIRLFGADSAQDLVGLPVLDRVHPDFRPVVMARIASVLDKGIAAPLLEQRFLKLDGETIDVEVQGTNIVYNGRPAIQVVLRGITERKLAQERILASAQALRESALHTQTILDNMADSVITVTQQGLVESFNKAAVTVFGYAPEEVLGQNAAMLLPEPHRTHYGRFLTGQADGSESRMLGVAREVEGLRKDGSLFPMSLVVSQITRGGQSTFIGIVRDITQHRRDVEEIRRLAFYDLLTGLPNRRLLMDRLRQAMVTSTRTGQHGALMFLDLDHFKTLNDTLGHDVGDVLLQQVARRLQSCVREGDSVARLGGDEFVVLLEVLSHQPNEAATQAEIVATKILDVFKPAFNLRHHHHESTPSIGIVVFLGDHDGIDDLLKKADVAMYQAKSVGRNAARFFDPAMQAVVIAHEAQEKDLRRGLAGDEFVLHYQVQVDRVGTPIGAEALVRWNHGTRGMLSPAHFIALAEETGLILPLGQWVLETACAQLVQWTADPARAGWSMAVNVSASQFAQTGFVANVDAALRRTNANPRLLKLELTESTLVDDVEAVIAKMNALKAFGVGFSLDDFGTGYSSLSYLKRLPLDQLKIDQSFVRDVLTDPSDAVIARTIIALGHTLSLGVIAEGVETADQRDFLAQAGCDAFQGYFFGRPGAAGALGAPTGQ